MTARLLAAVLICTLSAAGQTAADLVLINSNIHTLDRRNPRAEAIAVRGDRIIAVGSNVTVRKLTGERTKIIDARGKLVIPGFNDAHVHLTGIGNRFSYLETDGNATAGEIISKIAHFAGFVPKGRWVIGRGWDATRRDALPTLAELDRAAPAHPIVLYSADHSMALVNSLTLRLANLTSTGAVVSGDVLKKVRERIPPDHFVDTTGSVEAAGSYAASLGVTSVQDVHSDDLLPTLRGLDEKGRLKVRVYECVGLSDRKKLIAAKITAAAGTSMVRTGCVKGMAEGVPEEIDELRAAVVEADKAGLQVLIHAIGRDANANAIEAFQYAAKANGPRDRRFRSEHAARMRSTDLARLSASSVIASMQPELFNGGPAAGDDYRRLLDLNAQIAFGSDASMIDLDPLPGIYAAVNSGRRSLTVEEAVRAYTLGSAFAEFQENEKGTLEVGKLADLVMLSEDIFTIEALRIRNAKVVTTILGGRVVYQRK